MKNNEKYYEKYKSGRYAPWDIKRPDFNLIKTVIEKPIPPCRILDVGCGTGDNSIWLARQNFRVTGIDISNAAIEKAQKKAIKFNVSCSFIVDNFLNSKIKSNSFDFLFDRGCFHLLKTKTEQKRFSEKAFLVLKKEGLWLSLAGNKDQYDKKSKIPRLSAGEIISGVESHFKIISLKTSVLGSNSLNPPRIWKCLMQKRNYC